MLAKKSAVMLFLYSIFIFSGSNMIRLQAQLLILSICAMIALPSYGQSGEPLPQNATEKTLDSLSSNRSLDLMVRANVGLGDSAFVRSLSGDLDFKAKTMCVDIGALIKPDGPLIALNALGLVPAGARNLLQPLYIYSSLRVTPAKLNPSAANDQTFKEDLRRAIESAVKSRFGREIGVNTNGGASCIRTAWLLPRLLVDKGVEAKPFQGELTDIATITITDLRAAAQARQGASDAASAMAERARAQLAAIGDVLARSPPRGPDALYGALAVRGGRAVPCGVAQDETNAPRFDLDLRAIMTSEEFRAYMPQPPEDGQLFASAEELFFDIKAPRGRCTVVLANGPLLAKLIAALTRDGVKVVLLSKVFSEDELAELHVAALGFRDAPGFAAVDAWLLAFDIGGGKPIEAEAIERLRRCGVTSRTAYNDVALRLTSSGLTAEPDTAAVIDFCEDEREAAASGTTVARLRDKRQIAASAARIAAAAAERDMEARRAVEYPFKAILSCTMQNSVVALQSCLSNDGVETEVEFRNGADYRL